MEDSRDVAELVGRIKLGDQDSYEAVISRYQSVALHWARASVRDSHLAEDVVQEASIRMISKIHHLHDDKFNSLFRLLVHRLAVSWMASLLDLMDISSGFHAVEYGSLDLRGQDSSRMHSNQDCGQNTQKAKRYFLW